MINTRRAFALFILPLLAVPSTAPAMSVGDFNNLRDVSAQAAEIRRATDSAEKMLIARYPDKANRIRQVAQMFKGFKIDDKLADHVAARIDSTAKVSKDAPMDNVMLILLLEQLKAQEAGKQRVAKQKQ